MTASDTPEPSEAERWKADYLTAQAAVKHEQHATQHVEYQLDCCRRDLERSRRDEESLQAANTQLLIENGAARARIEQLEGALREARAWIRDAVKYVDDATLTGNPTMQTIDAALAQPPAVARESPPWPPAPEELLLNLLARIHRDGGQHTGRVGLVQSCLDADRRTAMLNARDCGGDPDCSKPADHDGECEEAESGSARDETKPPPGWRRELNSDGVTLSEDFVRDPSHGGRNWMTLSDAWALHDKDGREHKSSAPGDVSPPNSVAGPAAPSDPPQCPVTAAHGVHECVLPAGHDGDHRWDCEDDDEDPTAEDGSELPDGYEVQEHPSDLGDDGPLCTTYVAFAPMYADNEGDDETRDAAVARCHAHRDRICASERKARETAERRVESLLRDVKCTDEYALLESKLAAAERRAEEAEARVASVEATAERVVCLARAQAFKDVLQQMDRSPVSQAPGLREWVDRQRSLSEGRAANE